MSALGSTALTFVVAYYYGLAGTGVFAVTMSLITGLCILSRYGMNNSLVKYVGAKEVDGTVSAYLPMAMKLALSINVVLCIVVLLASAVVDVLFQKQTIYYAALICVTSFLFTISHVLAGYFKGAGKPVLATIQENGMISVYASALIVLFNQLPACCGGRQYDSLVALFLAGLFIVVQGLWVIGHWRSVFVADRNFEGAKQREFLATSGNFFLMSLSPLVQSSGYYILLGALLVPADVGLIKICQQLLSVSLLGVMAANTVFPKKVAKAWVEHDHEKIRYFARLSSLFSMLFSLPVIIGIIFYYPDVIALFDETVDPVPLVIYLFAFAQVVNVYGGSSNFILAMIGRDREVRNIYLGSSLLGLLALSGAVSGGITYVAGVMGSVIIFQNVLSVYFLKKTIGSA